jgi:hypothetical protein
VYYSYFFYDKIFRALRSKLRMSSCEESPRKEDDKNEDEDEDNYI